MSTKLFCPLIFYCFYLWNHQSTQLQILYCKTISSTKITFWDSETKSKKSKGKKELYPGVCIHICVLNFSFSLGISLDVVMGRILKWPSLQILPPTVYIPFKISRIMTLMNFSPLLRLFYGTINDYLDGLDWVSPLEERGSLYELRGVASKEVGTSVPQPAVLDFCQQEWAWKQIFPQNLQMRTHPISFSFKQRTQSHHARFFYRTVYGFTALSLW